MEMEYKEQSTSTHHNKISPKLGMKCSNNYTPIQFNIPMNFYSTSEDLIKV